MPVIHDFKPFVPSNDYALSKAFYQRLGFTLNRDSSEVCEIETGFGYRFLLLPKNHDNHAHSLMLHFMVDSAKDWHAHVVGLDLPRDFPEVKVAAPKLEPWGLLIT